MTEELREPLDLIELREAIETKLRTLCNKYGAHVATFHIYDEAQDSLIFPVGIGLRQEQRFEWLPSKRGPAAVILRGGQPVFAEDAAHHPQFRGPFTFDEGIKSGAGFPQLRPDGTRLNIIFLNYREEHTFADEEKDALTYAVFQAGMEIQDWITKLWPDIKAEEKWLREHAALQEIARAICASLPETEAVIWLFEPARGLVARAHSELKGISSRVYDVSIEASSDHYIAETFRTQKMRFINVRDAVWPTDVFHHEGASNRRWQSAIAIPLGREGVLTVYTVGYSGLINKEQVMLSAFADQAQATISSYNRIIALEALSRVGNQLNLEFGNPKELLNVIVETAANIMNADEITLHQFDPVRHEFLNLQHSVTYPPERQEELTPPRVESGASAAVLDNGRVSQGVDETDLTLFDTPHLREAEIQSFYGIRLDAGAETLGVLFFNYRWAREFTRDDITVINLFADYAASALRNAKLLQSVNTRRDELDVLNYIGRELTSRIRMGQAKILEAIYQQTAKLMDTRNFYIALYDPDTDVVSFELVYAGGKQAIAGEGLWMPRAGGKGATEAIIHNKKPLLLRTANEARDWYNLPENREYAGDIPEQYGYVGVPMIVGERVLGIISVRNIEEDNVYDEYDLTTLSTIGSQSAIALDHARLYDDVVKRLRALNEIGRELTSGIRLKEEEVVKLIYQQASRLLDMSNSYIALFDKESNKIRFVLAMDDGEETHFDTRPFGAGRTETIITTKKPIFIRTKAEAEAWYEQPEHKEYVGATFASWIGVPMIAGEEVLGVIAAYDDERDHLYRAADLEVLESLASQAAIALDNATLYYNVNQSLEERVEELQSVQDIIRAINSERDISALLHTVAQEACDILEADDAVVYQYDQEFNEFFQQVQLGEREHVTPQPGGSSEAVIQHGEIVFANDAASDPIVGKSSFTQGRGVQSCVTAPLKVGEGYVGILYVNFYTAPHHFTENERRITRIIADQAANAIWTVGRSETANRQLETVLRSIAVAKQSEKLPDLLQTYLELALNEINTKFGTIQLLDESTGELAIRSQLGGQVRQEYRRIPSDQGITGRAFTEKRMIYEPDTTKSPTI
jgi:GAF domain-containing protein